MSRSTLPQYNDPDDPLGDDPRESVIYQLVYWNPQRSSDGSTNSWWHGPVGDSPGEAVSEFLKTKSSGCPYKIVKIVTTVEVISYEEAVAEMDNN